jgi:hypothetical protein
LSQQDADADEEDRQRPECCSLCPQNVRAAIQVQARGLENLYQERVDGVVLSDLKESLDDFELWNMDVDASNSSTNNVSGKKKPKQETRTRQTKVKNFKHALSMMDVQDNLASNNIWCLYGYFLCSAVLVAKRAAHID